MVTITFRDEVKDERMDNEIRRMRSEGLSIEQMAKQLNTTMGDVNSRIGRMFRRGELPPTPRRRRA